MNIKNAFSNNTNFWVFFLKDLSLDCSLKMWAFLGLPGNQAQAIKTCSIVRKYYKDAIGNTESVSCIHIGQIKLSEYLVSFEKEIINELGYDICLSLSEWINYFGNHNRNAEDSKYETCFYGLFRLEHSPQFLSKARFENIKKVISLELFNPIYQCELEEIYHSEISPWDYEVDNYFGGNENIYIDISNILNSMAIKNILKYLRDNFAENEIKLLMR